MHKVILMALICVATVTAQSLTTIQLTAPSIIKHSLYTSTYDITLASGSNAMILLSCGGAGVIYGVGVNFLANTTLDKTDIDVRVYPSPFWTNATTNTKSPVWIPSYTNSTLNAIPDAIDQNYANAGYPQPIGTWLKNLGNSSFSAQTLWTGLSNVGLQKATYYLQADTAANRVTTFLPNPIMMAPNSQHFLILSNRTAAASNAVMRFVIQSYLAR